MAYLIGTDEAGYGPNLGPLVISACVWRVPDEYLGADLYKLLRAVVACDPCQCNTRRVVAWADSKVLYKSGQGLAQLERGLLSALGLIGPMPCDWRSLWHALDPDFYGEPCIGEQDANRGGHETQLPWHREFAATLPIENEPAAIAKIICRLQSCLAKLGVQLVALRSAAVFPSRFNAALDQHGNKSEALSRLTLGLLGKVLEQLGDEPILVWCDKHGGRNFYGPLLQQQFPDTLIEVRSEGREESIYRWGPASRRIEARFCVGGERHLPAAMASMASKYLRELAMRAFNDYWLLQVPDLRPTAGYPGDAARFKEAISARQQTLGIEDRVLWRSR